MKEELKQKMIGVIGTHSNSLIESIADKCAQLAIDYYKERDQALSMSGVVESDDLVSRSSLIEQLSKTDEYYKNEGRYQYSDGLNKARYLVARHGKKESL